MDALRKFGSMGRRGSAAVAAAEEAPDDEAAARGNETTTAAQREKEEEEEEADVGLLDGEQREDHQNESSAQSLTSPIRAPVSSDDDDGRYVDVRSSFRGLGVEQQGALMRLNQIITGESTLDTAIIEDCSTEEEFKEKIKDIARSKELSVDDDASGVSSIIDALIPLVVLRGQQNQTNFSAESPKVLVEQTKLGGDNGAIFEDNDDDDLTIARVQEDKETPQEDDAEDMEDEEEEEEEEEEPDIDEDDEEEEEEEEDENFNVLKGVMPVAKPSTDDEELIEEEEEEDDDDDVDDELEEGERSNINQFEDADDERDDEEEENETLFHTRNEYVDETLPRIIARESKDDETEEVAIATGAGAAEPEIEDNNNQVESLADAVVLPSESGSNSVGNEEPNILQEPSREMKEDQSHIDDQIEKVPSGAWEGSEDHKETESDADVLVANEAPTGELSKDESDAPMIVSEAGVAQPEKIEEDIAAAPEESSNSEEDATPMAPINTEQVVPGKKDEEGVPEGTLGEEADGLRAVDNGAPTESAIISEEPREEEADGLRAVDNGAPTESAIISEEPREEEADGLRAVDNGAPTESAIISEEPREEEADGLRAVDNGAPTESAIISEEPREEEADGLRAVDNGAPTESAIISEEPREEVKIEEDSSLSGIPGQISSDAVEDIIEHQETNPPVYSVRDVEDESKIQSRDLPATTEDFTEEQEDRDNKETPMSIAAENDTPVEGPNVVGLSLPDPVKSVEAVAENIAAQTRHPAETDTETKPELATLRVPQSSIGDWDRDDDDEEEVNDDEEEDDEDDDYDDDDDDDDEHRNLDAAQALAALVKSASGKTDSGSAKSNLPSLGAAGPSLPQRPTGRNRSATASEPTVRNPPRSNVANASQLSAPADENPSSGDGNDGGDETHEKLQNIRVKFLRLAHRLDQSPQNVVVAQVLYRLGLAEQLRGGRSASRAGAFSFDRANAIAEEQEASGQEEELDFVCTVLLLGKTGVGKSATINSIFDEPRTSTNAFHPSTKKVQEIIGNVHGIKVRVIDTPGLLPSVMDQQHNERIMGSVKQFIQKSSPDIVLYFDRLDMQSRDYGDLPLLRTITDVFGAAVWFNAIVVLTHASSAPPDGPNGVPLSYEMFVAQRSHVVQQTIRQAAGDMRLMNPVSLVENHPACRRNRAGERVLPNGQIWKPQLLLLCFASKILAEANSLLKLQDTSTPGRPFGQRPRVPPLPFLLSSLLQSRAQLKVPDEQQLGDEDDTDEDDDSADSDADDYDDLPPFRPLAKEELDELSKEQKQQYAEELADRERLFQKKQWREELQRRKEMKRRAMAMSQEELAHAEEAMDDDGGRAAAVPVPMPDMALPPSFDSDNPTHRYRYLETANQWLVRPVLETHGWDHDAGYDGFNVEKLFVVAEKIPASISGQVTKDKKEAQVNFEAAASFKHGEGKTTLAGLDIQTIGKDLGYTVRSETQFSNFKRNKTTAGLTFTLLGDTVAAGLKLEDRLLVGKRLKMVVNGGVLTGRGDKAFGGSLEATLKGKDYPLSRTLSTLGLSVMDWHGDLAIGGNLQSQFMVGKTMLVTRANLNNRGAGQLSIRASSSEQLQMVLIGIIPILRSLINFQFGTAQPSQ